jgi:DNA repair protein RecO (recombination protein O)
MRVDTQLVYILHKRAYRETSQILEIFSHDHGRLCLMSRASRGAKSRTAGTLQLFRPLLVSWQGKGEMPNLVAVDSADIKPAVLAGKALLSAMYLNELLMHLLHRNDIHPALFACYHDTLYALGMAEDIEIVLRQFEKQLLLELGFALNLSTDADSGEAVRADRSYVFHHEHGPVQCASNHRAGNIPLVSGASLLAFESNQLGPAHMPEIKQLMRFVLQQHLGHKRLKSRELFRPPA